MKKANFLYLSCLAFLASSTSALAESPRSMMLELHGGTYSPQVDSEFEDASPWGDIFGNKSMMQFKGYLDYQFFQKHGSLSVGGTAGFGWISGKALDDSGADAEDSVGFYTVPLALSLTYRWDWAAVAHNVPLVPYVKAGLSAAFWWSTNARGQVSNQTDAQGAGRPGYGITFGWHAGGGIMFLLDVFSDHMSANFDNEFGINNSYLFAEYLYQSLDNFGAGNALILTDGAFSFGIAFEF